MEKEENQLNKKNSIDGIVKDTMNDEKPLVSKKASLFVSSAENAEAKKREVTHSKESIEQEEDSGIELQEPIFINNAGLVLVSSFFPRFFDRLNLVKENAFEDNSKRERAVKLIQYLASGENSIREYDLPLNKVLCGMDINQTVGKEFEITDEEKENCESLLKSVIEYWSALKNTSVQGFRESFILRHGKLEENENQWKLNVEQKAFDILLDTIPWSYSIIKFNWMNKPVYVEWR